MAPCGFWSLSLGIPATLGVGGYPYLRNHPELLFPPNPAHNPRGALGIHPLFPLPVAIAWLNTGNMLSPLFGAEARGRGHTVNQLESLFLDRRTNLGDTRQALAI